MFVVSVVATAVVNVVSVVVVRDQGFGTMFAHHKNHLKIIVFYIIFISLGWYWTRAVVDDT